MSLDRTVIGLTTALTNLQLIQRLAGYKAGTTPFEKDAVLNDLATAIDNAHVLNKELLKIAKER